MTELRHPLRRDCRPAETGCAVPVMGESLPTAVPVALRSGHPHILQVPLRMFRYRQRLPELGTAAGPERIEGPALPEQHVLHRTLDF